MFTYRKAGKNSIPLLSGNQMPIQNFALKRFFFGVDDEQYFHVNQFIY